MEFYPSISAKLFKDALAFAKKHTTISDEETEILMHCRKGFLCHEGDVWTKKNNTKFDVTIGCFDGAEVAEIVGLFLINKVQKIFPGGGIYRDDGLAVAAASGPELTRKEKALRKLFQDHGLRITTDVGLVETEFLDVVLNLQDGSFRPYMKPNSVTTYINVQSSHPPSVIKALPKSIEKRLTDISSSEENFRNSKGEYEYLH